MSKSRFNVTKVNVLTSHRYNLPLNSECTICRCNLNEPSLSYQSKGIDSFVVVGVCGHSFHRECLDGWIKDNPRCPICANKWEFRVNEHDLNS